MNHPRKLPPCDNSGYLAWITTSIIGGRVPGHLWASADHEHPYTPSGQNLTAEAIAAAGFTVTDCASHRIPISTMTPVTWTHLLLMRLHDTRPNEELQDWLIAGLPVLLPTMASACGFAASPHAAFLSDVLTYDVCASIARLAAEYCNAPSLQRGADRAGFTYEMMTRARAISEQYNVPIRQPLTLLRPTAVNVGSIFDDDYRGTPSTRTNTHMRPLLFK